MRLLTLVRHAKSSWDDPALSDFERPLNARGRRDAPRMAQHLLQAIGRPDRMVSSPALRAITTARAFCEVLALHQDEILILPRIYEASVATLLSLVRQLDDGDAHAMLFGHNPGFSDLATTLAPCSFDEMPTCAAVQIALPVSRWSEVARGLGEVRHYACPRQLAE
ncbi:MAG TPA: histidine phosphatase family protein [Solimonas sp.]|nr:histidine phosphatase family protein [Solimonas sp.]